MCIIIVKPIGAKIPEKELVDAWNTNQNGSGFTWVDPETKQFKIVKEFKKRDDIIAKYKTRLVETGLEEKVNVLWHSRIKSAGAISMDNIHPFYMPKHKCMMAHNGTIYKTGVIDRTIDDSDTVQVKNWIENHLEPGFFEDPQRAKMFLEYFGNTSSRIVFLNRKGFIILNEDEGEWRDNLWFSKKKVVYTSSGRDSEYYANGYHAHNRNYHSGPINQQTSVFNQMVKRTMYVLIGGEDKSLIPYIRQKAAEDVNKALPPAKLVNMKDFNKEEWKQIQHFEFCQACWSPLYSNIDIELTTCVNCAKIGAYNNQDPVF